MTRVNMARGDPGEKGAWVQCGDCGGVGVKAIPLADVVNLGRSIAREYRWYPPHVYR